jgi:HEPN domain-containing protein
MPPEIGEVRLWLEKALHDLRAADTMLCMAAPITDVAGYHVQQALEKLLKAHIVYRGGELEKIHDLRLLAISCSALDASFVPWIERLAPLSAFAVRYRYPGPADPTVEETRVALAIAEEFWQFITARLPQEALPAAQG